ncbi:MAG: hypothetical protein A2509_10050, partial [Candidatus Edwardsbacteria bacterium RIFOXYD12_FULL_50_11]
NSSVTVIDGVTNDTATVATGSAPFALAVNPATNKIYVANYGNANVTVIDGATNGTATVWAGANPRAVAVNPLTNKAYVANYNDSSVTVIDGATNDTATVTVGAKPRAVAVNPLTNRIYVANEGSASVTVIDGATNDTTTVATGPSPYDVAVNPVSNMIFVANVGNDSVTVIDGATNTTCAIAAGPAPCDLAVNPVSNRIYVVNNGGSSVTVIDAVREWDTGITAVVDSSTNHRSYTHRPYITGTASVNWPPNWITLDHVLDKWMTGQEAWHQASVNGSGKTVDWTYAWGGDSLLWGLNYLNIVPLSQSGTTNNLGLGTAMTGNLLTYPIYYLDNVPPTIAWWDSLPDDADSIGGYGPYPVKAVIRDFSGIFTAFLHYDGDSVAMNRATADTFAANIPAQILAAGDSLIVAYSVSARDHAHDLNRNQSSSRTVWLYNLTGVTGRPAGSIPKVYALGNAYPNPSRGQTTFKYQLPRESKVSLTVYNVVGQAVKRFDIGTKPAGYHQINWNNNLLPNGVYIYQLKAGDFVSTRKLMIVR